MGNIHIKKDEQNPESAELLAKSIILVAEGFEKLLNTPLKERGIVQLLLGMPGMSGKITRNQIEMVLENLRKLKAWYIK